ncbi:alpha-L-rhamnosidase [Microbacterium sp. SS28]|uniref:alpha-L-rhamnosidase n=1 Tax=Microbacterium sp. SS28 TaxID=2919948 RepID=UPI001FA9B2F3|nr:alpha-L-rhamnosidase [Microbacterium sp. SS28]
MPSHALPTAVRFEHFDGDRDVLGIGTSRPRLSWQMPMAAAGFVQVSYEIEIDRSGAIDTFAVESADQVLVPWPAASLKSREQVGVRVRVRGQSGNWSGWSKQVRAEAGLFDRGDWTARFVSPRDIGGLDQPAPVVSTQFDVPEGVMSVRLYSTAHGIYVADLNGGRVSEDQFAPGWTAYDARLRYQVYDVTALVAPGRNTLTAVLGNGWYRGRLGYLGDRGVYGDRLAFLAQLEITMASGDVITIATDGRWRSAESGILADDFYNGQTTDLRHPFTDIATHDVDVIETDHSLLVAAEGPPVRTTQVLPARRVWRSPSGRTLVDFGQNAVGRVRLHVGASTAGQQILIRHAEVLENNELGTRPLRAAEATDRFILSGQGSEILEPLFTFHGFRYAEVTGVDDLEEADIELVVLGSELRRKGWFTSSDADLNQLHENVVWGMRGNFLDVPTDCPQRDERLGWTGDIQIFAPTASFLYDVSGFLSSWLADLSAEQLPDGTVPHIIPDIFKSGVSAWPAAAWGDAATVVPWVLYERTGDRGILERQFDSARQWVDAVRDRSGSDLLWRGDRQFGDWLDPTAPPDDPFRAKADPDVVASAHFVRSAEIVARMATVLGRAHEEALYSDLAAAARTAFIRAFVEPGGAVHSDSQTAYAMAILWDLLPDEKARDAAGERLAQLVRDSDWRISTGFVGTPLVCDALEITGHIDDAHRLLFQSELPSWLYPVRMGATTIWERWDSMLPDGTINPGEMTSFNHYALGAIADWMHRSVAGLAPAAPGYRAISVRPHPPAQLDFAEARHGTPYGEAIVRWHRTHVGIELAVTVPVGTTAVIEPPGTDEIHRVEAGVHRYTLPNRKAHR